MGALVPHVWERIGSSGLAMDMESTSMPPEYALTALNAVFSNTGNIESRQGFAAYSSAWASGTPIQIFEYLAANGDAINIVSTATDLFDVTTSAKTSRKGGLSPSAGDWKFLNFNGKVLGWQASHTPIVKTGSGNWAAISVSTGTLPDGNAAAAAFGRVWAVDDDKQTIRYCALLDETKWAAADGGGLIDMRTVWTQGMDEVIAIEAYGSYLVVFGRRHIILWADGSGSQLGLDPINMYVTDTIDHIGAINRNAVQLVGELDIAFWSNSGIRSLSRTMQERAAPSAEISPKNRIYIAGGVTASNSGSVRMAYHAAKGLLLAYAPTTDRILVFDTRDAGRQPNGELRMSEWLLSATALGTTKAGLLLLGVSDNLGSYSGFRDFTVAYNFILKTGWIDIRGEQYRKQALKMFQGQVTEPSSLSLEYARDFDVSVTLGSATQTITPANTGSWRTSSVQGDASYVMLYMRQSTTVQSAKSFAAVTLYTKPTRLA